MADALLIFSTPELQLAVCTASKLAQEAAGRHGLAPGSAAALGQALAGTLLLAGTDRAAAAQARVDVQLECGGPLRGLLVDADGSGAVRGLVRVNELSRSGARVEASGRATLEEASGRATLEEASGRLTLDEASGAETLASGTSFASLAGGLERFDARPLLSTGQDEKAGLLSILRAVPDHEAPHRATYPFAGADLGAALTLYLRNERAHGGELACEVLFRPSDPLASVASVLVWGATEEHGATARPLGQSLRQGALVQAMLAAEDEGRNAHALAQELSRALSLGPLRLDSEIRPRFSCRCSRERLVRALGTLGAAELQDMAARDRGASATCDFCMAIWRISAAELLELAGEGTPRA